MTESLLWLYGFISLGLLLWGFSKRERLYQYPFFMGAIFTTFILPQAISLVKTPGTIPETAIQRVLIMTSLCAAMSWIGYHLPFKEIEYQKPPLQLNISRLRLGSIIYTCVGFSFWLLVLNSPEGGEISGQSTGTITILITFGDLLLIGLVAILLETIRSPKILNIILLIAAAAMPIYRAVVFGRREETFFVFMAYAFSFYFIRRRTIPRLGAILSLFLAMLLIFNIGEYRNAMKQEKPELLLEINPTKKIEKMIVGSSKGDLNPELRNAALLIETTISTGKYGWGTGFWDRFVFRWVPAQLVGADLKQNLQLSIANYEVDRKYVYDRYSFFSPIGSTSTGIGDAFSQFDYFGCLIFAAIGIMFKYLWYRAVYYQCFIAQSAYILLSVKAMLALTHITVSFPSDIFFYWFFSLPLILYAKVNTRRKKLIID